MMKIIAFGILLLCFSLVAKQSQASTTLSLLPVNDGNYTQWTPNSGTSHYTQVDESSCNGNTDFNRETTVSQRDSYGLDLSSVPNGATITQIAITPCASKNSNGGTNTTFDVFYRLDGINSADMPGYTLTTTTPTTLSTTNFSGLLVLKSGTTSLEVGGIYTAGNKGARLSRIATVVTYSMLPTVTTNSATNITQTTATLNSTINPNGLSTTANYRYGTSNVGCSSLPIATSFVNVGSGSTTVSNPQSIASLSANTIYFYCATVTNTDGTTYGSVVSFTTLSSPPTNTTTDATIIGTNSAVLNSIVNPNGSSTNVSYRYDISNSSCSSLALSTSSANIGSGTAGVFPISRIINLLQRGTTYYFCSVASNSSGTIYGDVLSFTTLP